MIDPRFQEIDELLETAIRAQVEGDEQTIIEANYRIREIAWSINADILQGRWLRRHRVSELRRSPTPPPRRASLDDLLL